MTVSGDTGTGLLSAIGILHALYHRKRTGEGQFLRTSIVNAHLLSASHILARSDGSALERPLVDGMQLGFSALYGIYRTATDWLALAVLTDREWHSLTLALPEWRLDDDRFASAKGRAANDVELRGRLESAFIRTSAAALFQRLDSAGVPCEISDATMGQRFHDDPEVQRLGLSVRFDHAFAGRFEQVGMPFTMSETPGRIARGPIVMGDGTAELLTELGYKEAEIARLAEENVIGVWSPGEPLIEGTRRVMGAGKHAKAAETAG